MPLPAALAARLAKRGIVAAERSAQQKRSEQVEEVFAEDYDETHDHHPSDDDSDDAGDLIYESTACPNKTNPYHTCVSFCKDKWGTHEFKLDATVRRKTDRMLKKYPLPDGWLEVADPETNRFYFWNCETDEVSWLSPTHPRGRVTTSAVSRPNRPVISGSLSEGSDEEEDDEEEEEEMDLDMDDEDFERLEREIMREKEEKEARQRGKGGRRGRERVKEELDPMDPAAYSDIPRGSWSDGLERSGPKTGADVTASGPLFQQRPYPSPGAVLRMNKDKT